MRQITTLGHRIPQLAQTSSLCVLSETIRVVHPLPEGTGQEKQPYLYNGKELDADHGRDLYDYSARYYDANWGGTSVDPLTEKYYSWSPYAYVGNNPLRYIDPTGMDWWSTNNKDEIKNILAQIKSQGVESLNADSFGDNWTRVTDQELADGMAVFDDESMSFQILNKFRKIDKQENHHNKGYI